jgi:hypothetical protein
MVNPAQLPAAVANARPLAVPFTDVLFRATHLKHYYAASPPTPIVPQPLFCPPGGLAGSRYVRPHGPPALYLAQDAETAHREVCQRYYDARRTRGGRALIQAGQANLRPAPQVVIGVHVRLTRLMDLRNPATWLPLGIQSITELLGPWFQVPDAPTQLLGEAIHNEGSFEGILYPSARRAGRFCLVAFPDRLDPNSRIEFRDTGPLGSGLLATIP